MFAIRLFIVAFFILCTNNIIAQPLADSAFALTKIPINYASQLNKKIEKYNERITSKTEKTLTRLSRWENKIKSLLQKASPSTAEKLFGNNQLTFSSVLQKLQDGEALAKNYQAQYDSYLDNLTTSLKYIQNQESKMDSAIISPIKKTTQKARELKENLDQTQYVQEFIKSRKKQLISEATKYISNSKYFSKINKESYYYVATLKNYKEIFSDPQKVESTVKEGLSKILVFQKFMQQNSQLASLFRLPQNSGNNIASLSGLQTRGSVQQLIQQRIASGGPNAQAQIQQNLAEAHAELNKLKDNLNKLGGNGTDIDMPDFKPNSQKSKTLWQRMEYGFDVQFSKNTSWVPSTTEVAASLGYKPNDKSLIGVGIGYKLGMGTIDHIQFTHQGLFLRSFTDWKPFKANSKLFKSIWISGGYEMNYNAAFKNIQQLKDYSLWQRSALLGISKKYKISKKVKGEMKILYDFLAREHVPVSQQILFRLGYKF